MGLQYLVFVSQRMYIGMTKFDICEVVLSQTVPYMH